MADYDSAFDDRISSGWFSHSRVGLAPTGRDGRSAPAGSPLAKARIAAHAAFDPLWQDATFGMTRSAAYSWLAKQLGIRKDDCHMLNFDEAQCRAVEVACMKYRFLHA